MLNSVFPFVKICFSHYYCCGSTTPPPVYGLGPTYLSSCSNSSSTESDSPLTPQATTRLSMFDEASDLAKSSGVVDLLRADPTVRLVHGVLHSTLPKLLSSSKQCLVAAVLTHLDTVIAKTNHRKKKRLFMINNICSAAYEFLNNATSHTTRKSYECRVLFSL